MDNGTVVVKDVDFGMTRDPVFATKESPSHESDSGCSDMFDDRSVSPDVDILSPVGVGGDDDVELIDFSSLTNDDESFDDELASYFGAPFNKSEQTPMPLVGIQEQSSPVDIEYGNADPEFIPGKRIIQARALRPRKEPVVVVPCPDIIRAPPVAEVGKPEIRVLPRRACTSTSSNTNDAVKPPAVKVVKVIKTSATLKSEVDNELMKALDERNKKNAVQAKINREKKKAYIKNLEDDIEELKSENSALKKENEKNVKENKALTEEVEYLRSVLANESALAGLLKNIGNVENVRLSSSIVRKRSADRDHDYHSVPAKRVKSARTAGVCLHVDQGNVSIEFCSKCASLAKQSGEEENS